MHCRGLALAALVAALAPGALARADAPIDYLGPRELALGDSLRADARGSQAITLNPAGLATTRELVFEGSYGHRTGDGADTVTISGCDSTVAFPGCFYYRYYSVDLDVVVGEASRRVHEGGVTLSRAVTNHVLLGVAGKYVDVDTTGLDGGAEDGLIFDAGAVVRASDLVSLALVGYDVLDAGVAQYSPALGAGLSVRPFDRLGFSVDALWSLESEEGESTGRYGGGIEYFISSADMQTGYPVRLGAVHDVQVDGTYLSAGLGMATAKLGLDVGARRQIQGGDELVIQASLRIFGPRQIAGTGEYR